MKIARYFRGTMLSVLCYNKEIKVRKHNMRKGIVSSHSAHHSVVVLRLILHHKLRPSMHSGISIFLSLSPLSLIASLSATGVA